MAHTKLEGDSLPAFIVASIDMKKLLILCLVLAYDQCLLSLTSKYLF